MTDILEKILPYSGIIALVGTYCIIPAIDRAKMPDRVRKIGKTTQGLVTDVYQNPGPIFRNKTGAGFAPVVEFDYPNGHHRYASTTFQNPSPYKVGDEVIVWYHFYKSKQEAALEDDKPGPSVRKLLIWGIVLCLLSYPYVILRVLDMF